MGGATRRIKRSRQFIPLPEIYPFSPSRPAAGSVSLGTDRVTAPPPRLILALLAIRVRWLPERVAAAPAADAVLDQVPGDAADWAAALTWHGRAWVLLSDAGYADAAAVETLGRRLADSKTLSPEERQRLSQQMATLRRQIADPLVDPGWDPARAGIPPGTAGRNTP